MSTGTEVLTLTQARQITGGRKPLIPIEYEEACKSLAACRTIDDAKYFSDKADALATWAKIYNVDEAGIESRKLKLHAFKRIGDLARELRPSLGCGNRAGNSKRGTPPGPRALLMREHGMAPHNANAAISVSQLSKKKFDDAVNSPRPPSPNFFIKKFARQTSESWNALIGEQGGGLGLSGFRAFCAKHNPKDIARGLTPEESKKASEMVLQAIEWLDTFDQYLKREFKA